MGKTKTLETEEENLDPSDSDSPPDNNDSDNNSPEDMVLDEEDLDEMPAERNLLDEPNWEEQRLAIVNLGRLANQRFPWLNPDGPRRRHQIILREEGQDEANPDQADEESSEESENEENGDNQNFDTQLPTQHSYLGEGQQLGGRTILDEDLIQDLPIGTTAEIYEFCEPPPESL